jgi:hypothetical protein
MVLGTIQSSFVDHRMMKVLEGPLANGFCNEFIRMIMKTYVTDIGDCSNDRGSTIGLLRQGANW